MSKSATGMTKISNLKELLEINRLTLGELAKIPISDIGSKLAMASLLSRVYSVARGVVSLKFVAGDAFLRVQHQKKMQYMTEVLSDPKTVEIMHDVLVKGKTVTGDQVKYWKALLIPIIGETVSQNLEDKDLAQVLNLAFDSGVDEATWHGVKPTANMKIPVTIKSNNVIFHENDFR